MIELVHNTAPRAKQPWHLRVVAEGNSEPLLAGETLTGEADAVIALEALGRVFSPVHRATVVNGHLHVFLEDGDPEDSETDRLHVPISWVEEQPAKPAKTAAAKKAASSEPAGGES